MIHTSVDCDVRYDDYLFRYCDVRYKNVNSHAHELTTLFKAVLDKHAPLRAMSRNEKRLGKEPWITRGLLKSIRTKNKLYNTCYKSDDVAKTQKYKKYLNKLTHLKNISKRNYYESLIKTKTAHIKAGQLLMKLLTTKMVCINPSFLLP